MNCAVINKLWPIRRALVVVIILLYVLITISFAVGWSSMHSAFIGNGKSLRTVYLKLNGMRAFYLETGITASASTGLTDLYMVSTTLLRALYRFTNVLTLDLVLLGGLGTALAHYSASNIFPTFRDG